MKKELTIRPYARLITMLGDQLIKNETIALLELIKNSYDADANWVKVSFLNFNEDYSITPDSKIVIEDDGIGMSQETIEKHWLNPATPEKYKRKNEKTAKGRILQGEKGIGRFAVFKIGRKVEIVTRKEIDNDEGEEFESHVLYDFSMYDNDFKTIDGEQTDKDLFLEDLKVYYSQRVPTLITEDTIQIGVGRLLRRPHGTIIEISDLKSNWSKSKIQQITNAIEKLKPIFPISQYEVDFDVILYKDREKIQQVAIMSEKFSDLLDTKAVLKIEAGAFDAKKNTIQFTVNGKQKSLSFLDPDINGIKLFRDAFIPTGQTKDLPDIIRKLKTECGSFKFKFYIFDPFLKSGESKYYLNPEEKDLIKSHRIYLYRDGIRVMPYGDQEDDWLQIDMLRGTSRAGDYLSNDQVVGCVYISNNENPKLKDKTNREGLIEDGRAYADLIAIIQTILRYLRAIDYERYQQLKFEKREKEVNKDQPLQIINDAKVKYYDNNDVVRVFTQVEQSYKKEKEIQEEIKAKTDDLVAVGLSVETMTHDIHLQMEQSLKSFDALIIDTKSAKMIDKPVMIDQLIKLRDKVKSVFIQLKNFQILWPSTRKRAKSISVLKVIRKAHDYYKQSLSDSLVSVNIIPMNDLNVISTEAALLQVFLNLFDNSLYWLASADKSRKIIISIDSNNNLVIFADNGPGISDEDKHYVFKMGVSKKGEAGLGYGLYISRQLLDRYGFSINLEEDKNKRLLEGANFVIDFSKEGTCE